MSLQSRMKKLERQLRGTNENEIRIICPGGIVVWKGREGNMTSIVIDFDGNPLPMDKPGLLLVPNRKEPQWHAEETC